MRVQQVSTNPEVLVAVDDVAHVLAPRPAAALAPAHAAARVAGTGHPLTWRDRESLGARVLLRRLLAQVEPAARDVVMAARPGGQPYLPQWPGLAISLSHDGGHLGAAIGRCAGVGIDVQVPPPAPDAGLVRRCLRRHATRLEPLDDAARGVEFARVWTVQEACVKAAGTGIAGLPWAIDVAPGQPAGRWNGYDWTTLHDLWTVPVAVAWSAAPSTPASVPTSAAPSGDRPGVVNHHSQTSLLEVA